LRQFTDLNLDDFELLDSHTANLVKILAKAGIEKALGNYWIKLNLFHPRIEKEILAECHRILVLSGSVSPVTASQMYWAIK